MKTLTLCLMRHAEAQASPFSQSSNSSSASISQSSDFSRQLTPHGMSQAVNAGKILAPHLGSGFKALVSSSQRTRQTADLVLGNFKSLENIFDDKLYTANHIQEFIEIILSHIKNNDEKIMVIGHNPIISSFASYLAEEFISFSPSDFAILEAERDNWRVALNSQGCWYPKKF